LGGKAAVREPDGKADQYQREDRQPRPLCCFPGCRSRRSETLFADILRLIADLASPGRVNGGKRSLVTRPIKDGGLGNKAQEIDGLACRQNDGVATTNDLELSRLSPQSPSRSAP